MAKVRVKLNSAGVAALLKDEGVRDYLLELAERVADAARATAPVETGAYMNSIHAYTDTTDRAVGRVGSDVEHALVVQAKTGNLSKALDAAR